MRNQELRRRRDIALCHRFAYLTNDLAMRFDVAVRIMSRDEFFIQEKTIYEILHKYAGKELPAFVRCAQNITADRNDLSPLKF